MSNQKGAWGGVSFIALVIIGAVAIAHQWGLVVLIVSFVIAGVLSLVISYPFKKANPSIGPLHTLRAATLAGAALMVVVFLMIIAGIIAAGLSWGIWAVAALTIAWILWFCF